MNPSACIFTMHPSVWVSAYKLWLLVCEHVAPVKEKYPCQGAWTTDLLCHHLLKTYILPPSFSLLLPSAETLSVCVSEQTADPQLHTAALQFLCTVFTEETKSRSVRDTTLNCKPAPLLCDLIRGQSAGQFCDLLLQVGWMHLNYFHPFFIRGHFKWKRRFSPSHQSFEKITFQDPLKKLTARALMTFLACSPAAQIHAAQGISPVCLIIQETNVMFPHFCHAFFPIFFFSVSQPA